MNAPSPPPPLSRTQLLVASLALLAGLALRLWFVHAANPVDGDGLIYGHIAANWLQHNVFGYARNLHDAAQSIEPTLIRLPGYPLFLLLCFRIFGIANYTAVLLLQTLIDLASCLLLAALARRLFGIRAAFAALWLAALCPFTAIYVSAPLTETLSLACIALAFYALERWRTTAARINRWLYILAAALAYAILLRPEQGMLAAAIVPAVLYLAKRGATWKQALRPALLLSILTLLPLVPWTIRNEITFHVFQPLAPRFANDPGEDIPYGFQRWYRTWAIDYASTEQVYWNYDSDTIDIDDLPTRAFDYDEQYDATQTLLADYNKHPTATQALDARFDALARERITANPLRYYLWLPLARVANMVFRPRTDLLNLNLHWWDYEDSPTTTVIATLYGTLNLAWLIAAAIGFYRWQRRGFGPHAPLACAMAATILLRLLLLLTLDNSEPRYTLEFFPILTIFIASLWKQNDLGAPFIAASPR